MARLGAWRGPLLASAAALGAVLVTVGLRAVWMALSIRAQFRVLEEDPYAPEPEPFADLFPHTARLEAYQGSGALIAALAALAVGAIILHRRPGVRLRSLLAGISGALAVASLLGAWVYVEVTDERWFFVPGPTIEDTLIYWPLTLGYALFPTAAGVLALLRRRPPAEPPAEVAQEEDGAEVEDEREPLPAGQLGPVEIVEF